MTEVAAAQSSSSPQDIPRVASQWRNLQKIHLGLDTYAAGITSGGSFEKDRIVKSGRVLKRTRKTKSWKSTYIVLRPQLLNMYRDENESRLRNQIKLNEITAIARQKDPKRKEKHVFGIFTPSRNYHFEAESDAEAQDWVENIRQEARIYEAEEEMMLASPGGGARSAYQGFERAMDTSHTLMSPASAMTVEETPGAISGAGYSSSDVDNVNSYLGTSFPPRARARGHSNISARQNSYIEYSGTEGRGSYSDLSDAAGPTARLSALSLSHADGRPPTSTRLNAGANAIYGSTPTARPGLGARLSSQMSTTAVTSPEGRVSMQREQDPERVIYQGWVLLLKSKSKVRSWKKIWMVLRAKALAMYKNEQEYSPILILPFSSILEAVEINAISKSKEHCLQIITEERNYRLCTKDEESLDRWLGSFKSLLSKRRAAMKDVQQTAGS